jgi:hypothetical protein
LLVLLPIQLIDPLRFPMADACLLVEVDSGIMATACWRTPDTEVRIDADA